jgi:hypothetical protein
MGIIFSMKGLSGAALFGAFFLLLRKRHSRTCSQINYKALKVFVREIVIKEWLRFQTRKYKIKLTL